MRRYVTNTLLTLIGLGLIGVTALMFMLTQPINVAQKSTLYEYKSGMSVKALASDLKRQGIIKHPHAFEAYIRLLGIDKTLHAGEYRFTPDMSSRDLIRRISHGHVALHPFKIIEGWNIHELITQLQSIENIEHTLDFTDKTWLAAITTEFSHPEGLFMPDTYFYPKGETDKAILQRAFSDMEQYLTRVWETKTDLTDYKTPYQALIVASIVEKETSIPQEKPEVAGVLVRRLDKNMRLQMDPTVIYGIGPNFNGNITKADLQKDTPYNTYVRHGLPPTPIALPSRKAIYAALNPNEGSSLYFVAVGDGSHYFSETLEEHNQAVVKYILRPRESKE